MTVMGRDEAEAQIRQVIGPMPGEEPLVQGQPHGAQKSHGASGLN
jgi:hypothetical protein